MKVLVTGASGLIGSHLIPFLNQQGHTTVPLSLRNGKMDMSGLMEKERLDAVVHLAGESVADRWTAEKMARIKESRITGTKLLSKTLAELTNRPKVLVCASAIGYYGDRGLELLDESSSKGAGFLADVCDQWELATRSAREAGIRVVNLRIGVVLSKQGGALGKMLLPFQMGAGGIIGNGKQFMSWIDIEDLVRAIYHAIINDTLVGPVNAVAPYPVTNEQFTKALGKVLCRPTLIPVPGFGLRLLFGSMADEMLLSGQKVAPTKLKSSGYQFQFPDIERSLQHVLSKDKSQR